MKRRAIALLLTFFLLTVVYGASAQEVGNADGSGSTLPAPPAASTVLQYDDNTYEGGWGFSGDVTSCKFAVRFTPTFTPAWVTEMRFYMFPGGGASDMIVHVLDHTKAPIISSFVVSAKERWNIVDLSSYGIVITGMQDFYLALEWTRDCDFGGGYLTIDEDGPDNVRAWIYLPGYPGWELWDTYLWSHYGMQGVPYYGNWIIRAVIEELPGPVIPEFPFGTVFGLVMCMAALAVYKVKPIHLRL